MDIWSSGEGVFSGYKMFPFLTPRKSAKLFSPHVFCITCASMMKLKTIHSLGCHWIKTLHSLVKFFYNGHDFKVIHSLNINIRDEDPISCQNIYQNGVVRRLQLVNIN